MGARLREFSESMGWSKAELARRVGIFPQEVNGYIEGKYDPIRLLPSLLDDGLDPNWFISGKTPEQQAGVDSDMLRILRRNGIMTPDDLKRLIGKGVKYDFLTNPRRLGEVAVKVLAGIEKRADEESGINPRPRKAEGG
jgi:transcriptional regulator with XRE-family HTH domain